MGTGGHPPGLGVTRGRLPAAAAVLAIGVGACLGAGVLPLLPVAASSAADASVGLVLTAGNGLVRPGEDLVITGSVSNLAGTPLSASTLSLGVSESRLDRGELAAALRDPGAAETEQVGDVTVPALPAGTSADVTFTVPAARASELLDGSGWGAHVVTGEVRADSADLASATAGFAWLQGAAPPTLGVATVIPLTTPAVPDGLLDAEALEAYTAVGGALRKKLDAGISSGAALALDPRILASIRALGANAPTSAVEWLQELDGASNLVFPLGYGDADLSLERGAGAGGLLGPISFDEALDPANFADGDGGTLPSPTPSLPATPDPASSATPTPSPTSTAGALPTTDELLAWDYSATDLAWPVAVRPGDTAFYAASGLSRTLVPSDSLADGGSGASSGVVEGGKAIVVDSMLSEAVSEAAFAGDDADGRHAIATAVALLAATAETTPGGSVVVALSRSWPSSTTNLSSTLDTLATVGWTSAVPLDSLPASDTALTLAGVGDDPRRDLASQLLIDEGNIAAFSSVLADPTVLVARERLRLLPLLSVQWLDFREAWTTAAGELHTSFDEVLHAVSISPTDVVALGAFDSVPVYVQNDLDLPVTIQLDGRPSNGRLLVEPTTATIAAQSSQRVFLPARSIANGRVTLYLDAASPTGVPIGSPASLTLDVQAEWETAGLIAVGGLVALLFGVGLFRYRRRRRRARAEEKVGDE